MMTTFLSLVLDQTIHPETERQTGSPPTEPHLTGIQPTEPWPNRWYPLSRFPRTSGILLGKFLLDRAKQFKGDSTGLARPVFAKASHDIERQPVLPITA